MKWPESTQTHTLVQACAHIRVCRPFIQGWSSHISPPPPHCPERLGAKAAGTATAMRGRQRVQAEGETATSPRTPGTPSASGSLPARGCGLAARVSSSADPAGHQRQRPGSSRGIDAAPPGSGRRCGELFQALPLCPHHTKTSPLCS